MARSGGFGLSSKQYPSRGVEGSTPWSIKDILRKSHTVPNPKQCDVFKWVCNVDKYNGTDTYLNAVNEIKENRDLEKACSLITQHGLPREVVPTELLNHKSIWVSLLHNMPYTALIRNLNKMTIVGISDSFIVEKVLDSKAIKRSRIHPMQLLIALYVYKAGRGVKGSLTWTPYPSVISALEEAFEKSVGFVEPTKKYFVHSLDVSGSMAWNSLCNVPSLTPAVVAAALLYVAIKSEPNVHVQAFSNTLAKIPNFWTEGGLSNFVQKIYAISMGSTDLSLPVVYAINNDQYADVFVCYTDNQCNCGRHLPDALKDYRSRINPNAKYINLALENNTYTVGDPQDPNTLSVVGCDPSLPQIIKNFVEFG